MAQFRQLSSQPCCTVYCALQQQTARIWHMSWVRNGLKRTGNVPGVYDWNRKGEDRFELIIAQPVGRCQIRLLLCYLPYAALNNILYFKTKLYCLIFLYHTLGSLLHVN
jgi:hypothetical protein